jgi:hypothetical protein
VILTGDDLRSVRKELSASMGFFQDSGRQDKMEEMKQLMSLFFFVGSAEVKQSPYLIPLVKLLLFFDSNINHNDHPGRAVVFRLSPSFVIFR